MVPESFCNSHCISRFDISEKDGKMLSVLLFTELVNVTRSLDIYTNTEIINRINSNEIGFRIIAIYMTLRKALSRWCNQFSLTFCNPKALVYVTFVLLNLPKEPFLKVLSA